MGYKSKFEPAPFGNEATSSISGDLYVNGEIYANSFHVDVITKTITNIEQSGATKFGDTPDDLHQMTGTLSLSASATSPFDETDAHLDLQGTNPVISATGGPDTAHLHIYSDAVLYLGSRNNDAVAIGRPHPDEDEFITPISPIFIHHAENWVSLSGSATRVTGSFHMTGSSASFDAETFRIGIYSVPGAPGGQNPFNHPHALSMRTHPFFESRSPQVCFGVSPEEVAYNGANATYTFAESMDVQDPASGGGYDIWEADMQLWFSGSEALAASRAWVSTFGLTAYNGGGRGGFQKLCGTGAETDASCSWAPTGEIGAHALRIFNNRNIHFVAGDPGPYDTTASGELPLQGQLSQTSSMILFDKGGLFVGRPYSGTQAATPVGGILISGSTILSSAVNFAGYQAAAASLTASVDAAIIGCTATGITITLDDPSLSSIGRVLIIKDETGTAGLTPITISASVGTIDGETTQDLDENHEAVSIYSNGSNWFIY